MNRSTFVSSVFRTPSSEQYKRFIIMLVYSSIQEAGTISESKLRHLIKTDHLINESDIDGALSALHSSKGLNAISVWNGRHGKLMRVRASSEFNAWKSGRDPEQVSKELVAHGSL